MIAPIGCTSTHDDTPPPTIAPAVAAVSPPVAGQPQGSVRPLAGIGVAAAFDPATSSLVVLELDPAGASAVTTFPVSGPSTTVPLPGPATAIVADGDGAVYLSAKGGYFKVDVK
ncbi:MAG: hypothetical protein ACRDUX_29395, partial [Mycobacterium sp.]